MTANFDRILIERIFSDARVIDIDMSEWDEYLSLWVLADHYEQWAERCPVVAVDFRGVQEFSCRFPSKRSRIGTLGEHLQWWIDDYTITEHEGVLHFVLFAGTTSPWLKVACEGVSVRRVSNELLDSLFPEWNRPDAGLARPNIEKLAEQMRG